MKSVAEIPTNEARSNEYTYTLKAGAVEQLGELFYNNYHADILRIGTYPDGSCLIHSIYQALMATYDVSNAGKCLSDIREVRNSLAMGTEEERRLVVQDPTVEDTALYLLGTDMLGAGPVAHFAKTLDIDIYIWDVVNNEPYRFGRSDAAEIQTGRRESIVLAYIPGVHFEVIGLKYDHLEGSPFTVHAYDSPFITWIRMHS